MLATLQSAHLAPRNADVPHAAPLQHFRGVPGVVVLRLRLIHGPHAAGAKRVHEGEGTKDKALRFALQEAFGLEFGENSLSDEELGERRRFRSGILVEELADDL